MRGVTTTSHTDYPPAWRTDPDPSEPETLVFYGIHPDIDDNDDDNDPDKNEDDSSTLNLGSTDEGCKVEKDPVIDDRVEATLDIVDGSNVPASSDDQVCPVDVSNAPIPEEIVNPSTNNVKETSVPSPTEIIKAVEQSTPSIPTASAPHGNWWCCGTKYDSYEDTCKVGWPIVEENGFNKGTNGGR